MGRYDTENGLAKVALHNSLSLIVSYHNVAYHNVAYHNVAYHNVVVVTSFLLRDQICKALNLVILTKTLYFKLVNFPLYGR